MSNSGKEANDWYSLQERALKLSDQAFKNLIGEYEDQIRSLRYEISSRDKKILDLKGKLELSNRQVNSLKAEKSELCNLLDAIETQNKNRDSKMEELLSELSEIKDEHEQSISKLERCLKKYVDTSNVSQSLNGSKDDDRSILSEQCENIEIKEIPNLLVSEVINHPSNFLTSNSSVFGPLESKNGPEKMSLENPNSEDISHYSVSRSGVWNRVSQVLPKDSYFSLLNYVRQYHLGLMNEEELQTEIQSVLLSNNEAVRNAFTKDILDLSSK
ncbi:hypothetical protein OJ253_3415 [Cryptosporidium canis]|uniref:Uncharacterized protein n=1 Tax=Cryptosporidium canis TaxID=195482 RepID=A0A9D5HVW2_9CRYT|nr:hypothetical protein OJ253_3415 [Cryptosporidium canis]